ncbi:MAG: EamA family transporter [Candidatus Bathyarchaeia archaeon]
MYGEVYAIATAILRGFSVIPIRKGLKHSTPTTSALIYLIINTAILWTIVILQHPLNSIISEGTIYFVLAGVAAPGIAARFRDTGISRLGVTLTSPIVGTTTFISMTMAVFILGEKLTPILILGAALIFTGVTLLTKGGSHLGWQKRDLIYPVAAAILFALSTNLRKIGLARIESPVVGAAITSLVSLVTLLILIVASRARGSNSWAVDLNPRALKYFGFSGTISSIAFLLYFMALNSTFLVKIQPITGSNPLFALIFSYIFIKDVERINRQAILATLLIVAGIVLIAI